MPAATDLRWPCPWCGSTRAWEERERIDDGEQPWLTTWRVRSSCAVCDFPVEDEVRHVLAYLPGLDEANRRAREENRA